MVEITTTTTTTQSQPTFPFGGGGSQTQESLGTGFVYDTRGGIVTNEHVIDGATSISVKLAGGSTFKATVVGSDASADLALLHISAATSKLHPLALADSSTRQDRRRRRRDRRPVRSYRHRHQRNRQRPRTSTSPNNTPTANAIQTDAAINHGSSGGPLLNMQGQLVGVTAQIQSDSDGNNGVAFAIPSNTVEIVVAQLLANT